MAVHRGTPAYRLEQMSKTTDLPADRRDRKQTSRRRNKGFEETHALLIDTAVRLMSHKGAEALSLSEIARAAGVNRTTVYYHFDSREALLTAVRDWSAEQLAAAFVPSETAESRPRFITRFVLENPEVVALWSKEFLAPGHVAERYPRWHAMVEDLRGQLSDPCGDTEMDAEAFAAMLLAGFMIGPRVYRNSVRPELPLEECTDRLIKTQLAMLQRMGLTLGR